MLRFFKSFFSKKNEPAEPAPYKVETPVVTPVVVPPVQCGCGRSTTGLCVGLHKLTAEEWAAHPDNPVKPAAAALAPVKPAAKKAAPKKAPAQKKPAADKPAAKPAAMTASKRRPSKKTPV